MTLGQGSVIGRGLDSGEYALLVEGQRAKQRQQRSSPGQRQWRAGPSQKLQ